MTLRDILLNSTSFIFEKNIFHQTGLSKHSFEKSYLNLRKRENRIYPDDVVQNLPEFSTPGPLNREWAARKITLKKLLRYFNKRKHKLVILELGCGNGWLSHQLASSLDTEVLGLDINETELLQGARLFQDRQNLAFMSADIFTADIRKETFDVVVLAASIQYFPNLTRLLHRLLELLKPSGEIHIVDSPLYNSSTEVKEALSRSVNYFTVQGVPEMSTEYFHHRMLELKSLNYQKLSKPNSLISVFKRKFLRTPDSIFPWILIKHPRFFLKP